MKNIKFVSENMLIMHKQNWFLTERIILRKMNAISESIRETFYLINHKNANIVHYAIHLHVVDIIGVQIQNSLLKQILYDITHINMGLFSVETLECAFTLFRH